MIHEYRPVFYADSENSAQFGQWSQISVLQAHFQKDNILARYDKWTTQ